MARKGREALHIALWHGYLLADTGSNIFTRELARALTRRGHQVTLFCQDPDAEARAGDSVTVVRPEIGRHLPVFVEDGYPDLEARHVARFEPNELERYITVNADAISSTFAAGVDLVLANHAILGGPVAQRACAGSQVPYAVYVHGSELEYAIRGRPRLVRMARDGIDEATAVIAGSRHIEQVTSEVLGAGSYMDRFVRLTPGVDIERFHPDRGSLEALVTELRRDGASSDAVESDRRRPDPDAADRVRVVGRFVLYAGKLMEEKGVDLLVQAWSDISDDYPGVHLVVVGFGRDRASLEDRVRGKRVVFTGHMSHDQLQLLMPLADAVVVPSVVPEAFGMIAAEAAAAGVPPLVANHSGLAEVAETLGEAAFKFDGTVEDLRVRLDAVLRLDPEERVRLGELARATAVANWSWDAVASALEDIAHAALH